MREGGWEGVGEREGVEGGWEVVGRGKRGGSGREGRCEELGESRG